MARFLYKLEQCILENAKGPGPRKSLSVFYFILNYSYSYNYIYFRKESLSCEPTDVYTRTLLLCSVPRYRHGALRV